MHRTALKASRESLCTRQNVSSTENRKHGSVSSKYDTTLQGIKNRLTAAT